MMGGKSDSSIIKPISKADVHRICSGQVILDLASAVKELVENSLDAGATSIDVRLKDYGGDSIEVGDNGCGISPDNYQSATLKHHTSKISDFSDLQSLKFFGFRGEALSSLCALGNVTIETRTRNESVGTQLIVDHSGLIVSKKNIARQIGTTVTVAKLFSSLPVRYKEFHRSIRREYGRVLSLLNAYALIAKGVRLVCSNTTGRSPKTLFLKTQGSGSVKDNIITVFGTKTIASLEPLDFSISDGYRIEGFVSKPGSGSGRASGDRQFFYVNGRPVDMPKLTKLLNELYRSFNSQQYPMAVLNFILPSAAYDVNVTPDKRKIFFHDESLVMKALKESLEQLYSPNKYTYAVNNFECSPPSGQGYSLLLSSDNAEIQAPPIAEDHEVTDNVDNEVDLSSVDNAANVYSEKLLREPKECAGHDASTENLEVDDATTELISAKFEMKARTPLVDFTEFKCRDSVLEFSSPLEETRLLESTKSSVTQAENSLSAQRAKGGLKDSGLISRSRQVQSNITGFVIQNKRQLEEGYLLSEEPVLKKWKFCADKDARAKKENVEVTRLGFYSDKGVCSPNLNPKNEDKNGTPSIHNLRENLTPAGDQKQSLQVDGDEDAVEKNTVSKNLKMSVSEDRVDIVASPIAKSDVERMSTSDKGIAHDGTEFMSDMHLDNEGDNDRQGENKDIAIVHFDINRCRLKCSRGLLRHDRNAKSQIKDKGCKKRCYSAATLAKGSVVEDWKEKEDFLAAATRELERSFNKEDFRRMKVVGQFNLGFIIAKIDEDLFIIDQHASDEKYNFERLSQTTILNRQPLLRPLVLEIPVAEEVIISMHMDTFRRNGFDFIEDTNAPPGKRFLLSAVPYSKNITFGVGDVQELISILVDKPSSTTSECSGSQSTSAIYPSRVHAMLASRACRSSVMIGDALRKKDMEMILQHLSTLNSPWNCPHGRPTMRHLVDLTTLSRS